jgi:hypothetical protein
MDFLSFFVNEKKVRRNAFEKNCELGSDLNIRIRIIDYTNRRARPAILNEAYTLTIKLRSIPPTNSFKLEFLLLDL